MRTAIVTGANSGIGFHTASALAAGGARTVLACRDEGRADRARTSILARHPGAAVEVLRLDLGDLRQIADAASEARERFGSVQICVNNAGVMTRTRSVTTDGFETTFAVNHLGHFAWTAHLLPALLAEPGARVVTVSSIAHLKGTMAWDDLMGERTFSPVAAYRQAKLANLLHCLELSRRWAGTGTTTTAVAAHPGVSASGFWENAAGPRLRVPVRVFNAGLAVVFNTARQGSEPVVHAATAPEVEAGRCYGPHLAQRWGRPGLVRVSDEANDADAAARLWRISEELTGRTTSG